MNHLRFARIKEKYVLLVNNRRANGWYEFSYGSIAHYKNGICHNDRGPAHVGSDGKLYWYLNGIYIPCNTQEKFLKLLKLKAFL